MISGVIVSTSLGAATCASGRDRKAVDEPAGIRASAAPAAASATAGRRHMPATKAREEVKCILMVASMGSGVGCWTEGET